MAPGLVSSWVKHMDFISVFLIAVSLSMDCFAVALSFSIARARLSLAEVLRTALSFGSFQYLMPVLGWLGGRTIVNIISGYDHWVAFGLLAFVGGRMVRESFRGEEEHESEDISRGILLLTMSVATSIDALAVGLSFALLDNTNIFLSSLIIGVTCFMITVTGFLLGRKAGEILGKRAKLAGGLILIGIGVRILIEHLTE